MGWGSLENKRNPTASLTTRKGEVRPKAEGRVTSLQRNKATLKGTKAMKDPNLVCIRARESGRKSVMSALMEQRTPELMCDANGD